MTSIWHSMEMLPRFHAWEPTGLHSWRWSDFIILRAWDGHHAEFVWRSSQAASIIKYDNFLTCAIDAEFRDA